MTAANAVDTPPRIRNKASRTATGAVQDGTDFAFRIRSVDIELLLNKNIERV